MFGIEKIKKRIENIEDKIGKEKKSVNPSGMSSLPEFWYKLCYRSDNTIIEDISELKESISLIERYLGIVIKKVEKDKYYVKGKKSKKHT